jgi:hypothetical protein
MPLGFISNWVHCWAADLPAPAKKPVFVHGRQGGGGHKNIKSLYLFVLFRFLALAGVQQFIDKALAPATLVNQYVFKIDQFF